MPQTVIEVVSCRLLFRAFTKTLYKNKESRPLSGLGAASDRLQACGLRAGAQLLVGREHDERLRIQLRPEHRGREMQGAERPDHRGKGLRRSTLDLWGQLESDEAIVQLVEVRNRLLELPIGDH